MGGPLWTGSAVAPDGAIEGGKVRDPAAVASALKQLLARNEIVATRALVAASDAVASFRVLKLPGASDDSLVESTVARELPNDPQRLDTRWVQVRSTPQIREVFAAAWDRGLVANLVEAIRLAGLQAAVVELKSACVARTVLAPSCVLVDLSADPIEIFLIDDFVPQVWHSVPADASSGEQLDSLLAPALRSVLRFYKGRRVGSFGNDLPVLISGEQAVPSLVMGRLSELVDHPVQPLPAPPRIPGDLRHATYLACLGLIMRRRR